MHDLDETLAQLDLKALFIVWGAFQGSRRSEQIAKRLGIDVEYIYFTTKQGFMRRLNMLIKQWLRWRYWLDGAPMSYLYKTRPSLGRDLDIPIYTSEWAWPLCLLQMVCSTLRFAVGKVRKTGIIVTKAGDKR